MTPGAVKVLWEQYEANRDAFRSGNAPDDRNATVADNELFRMIDLLAAMVADLQHFVRQQEESDTGSWSDYQKRKAEASIFLANS